MSFHSPDLCGEIALGHDPDAMAVFVRFCVREWDPDPSSQSRIAARLPDGFGEGRMRSTIDVLNDLMEVRLHHGRRAADIEQRRRQSEMFVQLVAAAALGRGREARSLAEQVVQDGKADALVTLAREFAARLLIVPAVPAVAVPEHACPRHMV